MASFNQILLFTFIMYSSFVYRLINTQSSTVLPPNTTANNSDETTDLINTTTTSMVTNTTTTSNTNSTPNNSTNLTKPSITTTTSVSTSTRTISTSTNSSITTAIDNSHPPNVSSGPGWWLLIGLLITIVIVIIAGVIFYHRQHAPYRRSTSCLQWCRQCKYRFLQNWRSRDDDADNIILQLEQTESPNDQWPPRISFT